MGVVVSRFNSKNDDNYEKILSEIDDSIRKTEISLGEIRKRGNKALIVWMVYSLLAYIAYALGYWYFIYMSNQGEDFDFMKVVPVIIGPFFIVVGCKFLNLWYKRNETNETSQLEHLKAKQKLKLEEMKKRTSYYLTKTLLDRYDSPTNSPINQQQQPMTPGQKITSMTTPGSLKRDTPNSLRQRLLPNNNNDNDNNGNIDRQTSRPLSPNQTNWYDKLVDVVAGKDEQKYALICKDCYNWNGLAFPAEFDDIQYYCKNCNHFNPSRKSLMNGTVLAPQPQPLSKSKSLSPSNGNIDASIVDSSSPRRGRSTSPKPTSRDSSSDPETLNEKYDGYDDGIAVSEKKGSHCRTDDNDNDDDL